MKILMFAPSRSIHTHKWATYFQDRGYEVKVATFSNHFSEEHAKEIDTVKLSKRLPGKFSYLTAIYSLNKLIDEFQPDILHAHYLSSYGFISSFNNFHPNIVSVWGSDIYQFPKSNSLNERMVKKALKHADYICSTSADMAKEINKYINKDVVITPFGVDINIFKPLEGKSFSENKPYTVGIAKGLIDLYGFPQLFKAFAKLKDNGSNVRLLIVGDGPKKDEYKNQIENLGISDVAEFVGRVKNEDVPYYLHQMDVFVLPSEQESFGVAALEAQACGIPVVVNRVGGLPEVVLHDKTGIVLENNQPDSIYEALEFLRQNPEKRIKMGHDAVGFVQQHFSWNHCGELMEQLYQKLLDEKRVIFQ